MVKPKANPLAQPYKELTRLLITLGRQHDIDRIFLDWVEMMALAISNSIDRAQFDVREERYMQIVKRYSSEEAKDLCHMYAYLVAEMERTNQDVLGRLIYDQELHLNKYRGQIFSPWSICEMAARTTFVDKAALDKIIAERGFFTLMEPACGGGSMILAAAKVLQDLGINYQKHLHVTAVDIDAKCVHMTYVQCSLMGIPAIILRGNSLGPPNAITEAWYTPLHVLGLWNGKLKRLGDVQAEGQYMPAPQAIVHNPEPEMPDDTEAAEIMVTTATDVTTALAASLPPWQVAVPPGTSPPFPEAD